METSRILFVDDDPSILRSIERGFRGVLRDHQAWQPYFVTSGGEAMELLDGEAFDVIVSDIDMPFVDGVAVLKYAHATHPEMLRIGLSGECSEELALKAASVAHQSLIKPVAFPELENTLRRAFRIRALIADPQLRSQLGALRELPALPQTYARLTTVLDDPHAGMADVARVVETDVASTAKILQLVNSAFFGVGHPVRTILQAVQLLGIDLVKNLVLATGAFTGTSTSRRPQLGRIYEALQLHSIQVAHVAASIADPAARKDSMTAGLLHDIGWLVRLQCTPASAPLPIDRHFATASSEPPDNALHAALGAYLLGLWGLPLDVIDAVATHHTILEDHRETPIARNVRRAEMGLRAALAERATSLRERAIAIAATL